MAPSVEFWAERLNDQFPAIQKAAIQNLAARGEEAATPVVIKRLVEVIKGPNRDVRQAAAKLLGSLPMPLEFWVKQLNDASTALQILAIQNLATRGKEAATPVVVDRLVDSIRGPKPKVGQAAANLLCDLAMDAPEGVKFTEDLMPALLEALIKQVASQDPAMHISAKRAAMKLAKQAKPQLVRGLVQALDSAQSETQEAAARLIAALGYGMASPEIAERLEKLLASPHLSVQYAAVGAMWGILSEEAVVALAVPEEIEVLLKWMVSPNLPVRGVALKVVKKLGEVANIVLPAWFVESLVGLLGSPDMDVQRAALWAATRLREDDFTLEVALGVVQLVSSESKSVRLEAIKALGVIVKTEEMASEVLEKILLAPWLGEPVDIDAVELLVELLETAKHPHPIVIVAGFYGLKMTSSIDGIYERLSRRAHRMDDHGELSEQGPSKRANWLHVYGKLSEQGIELGFRTVFDMARVMGVGVRPDQGAVERVQDGVETKAANIEGLGRPNTMGYEEQLLLYVPVLQQLRDSRLSAEDSARAYGVGTNQGRVSRQVGASEWVLWLLDALKSALILSAQHKENSRQTWTDSEESFLFSLGQVGSGKEGVRKGVDALRGRPGGIGEEENASLEGSAGMQGNKAPSSIPGGGAAKGGPGGASHGGGSDWSRQLAVFPGAISEANLAGREGGSSPKSRKGNVDGRGGESAAGGGQPGASGSGSSGGKDGQSGQAPSGGSGGGGDKDGAPQVDQPLGESSILPEMCEVVLRPEIGLDGYGAAEVVFKFTRTADEKNFRAIAWVDFLCPDKQRQDKLLVGLGHLGGEGATIAAGSRSVEGGKEEKRTTKVSRNSQETKQFADALQGTAGGRWLGINIGASKMVTETVSGAKGKAEEEGRENSVMMVSRMLLKPGRNHPGRVEYVATHEDGEGTVDLVGFGVSALWVVDPPERSKDFGNYFLDAFRDLDGKPHQITCAFIVNQSMSHMRQKSEMVQHNNGF